MPCEKRVYRQRYCSMTPRDEDDFSALLRENFPDIVFFNVDQSTKSFILHESIRDSEFGPAIFLLEPGWKPKLRQERSIAGIRQTVLQNWPKKRIWYHRAYIQEFDLSKVREEEGSVVKPLDFKGRRFTANGQFQGSYGVDHPDEKRFIQKFYRLIGKFMTNAYDIYDLRTGKYIETITGGWLWCGPDAIRMCREEKDFVCDVFFRTELDTWTGSKAIPKP